MGATIQGHMAILYSIPPRAIHDYGTHSAARVHSQVCVFGDIRSTCSHFQPLRTSYGLIAAHIDRLRDIVVSICQKRKGLVATHRAFWTVGYV